MRLISSAATLTPPAASTITPASSRASAIGRNRSRYAGSTCANGTGASAGRARRRSSTLRPRSQPRHDREIARPRAGIVSCRRDPGLGPPSELEAVEPVGCDADDDVLDTVNRHQIPEAMIDAERAVPERAAHHHRPGSDRRGVRGDQQSSVGRRHGQRLEQLAMYGGNPCFEASGRRRERRPCAPSRHRPLRRPSAAQRLPRRDR